MVTRDEPADSEALGAIVESVLARDYPTVLALFTVSAVLTLIGILLSDLLLAVVDPRIAFGRRQQ
jgi:ABC-type dipeptide/oligopeptide/nickel transport system permease component